MAQFSQQNLPEYGVNMCVRTLRLYPGDLTKETVSNMGSNILKYF